MDDCDTHNFTEYTIYLSHRKRRRREIVDRFLDVYSMFKGTLWRTAVYTVGNVILTIACVMYFTGVDIGVAAKNAIVEPLLNAVWYFMLDRIWSKK